MRRINSLMGSTGALLVVLTFGLVASSPPALASRPSVAPLTAGPKAATSAVKIAPYRIPDRFLSTPYNGGSFGYGYPPAYGFDTADHNIQCYIAQSEDSGPYACGIQKHAWRPPAGTLMCTAKAYVGVLGLSNGAEGGAGVNCSTVKTVPRQRNPHSTAITGSQVNRVLRPGTTISAFGIACTATGTGKASTIRCTDRNNSSHSGFRISYSSVKAS